MYKKLIKDLPFQPSLIGDVALAAKQARRDRVLYSISLLSLVLLALIIFISPQYSISGQEQYKPTQSLVPFGFVDKQSAVDVCDDEQSYYSSILRALDVTCAQLREAEKTTYGEAARRLSNQTNLTVIERATPNSEKNTNSRLDIINHPSVQLLQSDKNTLGQHALSRVLIGSHDSDHTFILFLNGEKIATTQSAQNLLRGQVMAAQTDPKSNEPRFCVSEHEKQCLQMRHRVINETQSLANTNKKSVNPGDVLRYEFIVENHSDKNHTIAIKNNSSSILDRALLVNANNGELDPEGIISWPTQTIEAGETIIQSITVEIKETTSRLSNKTIENYFGNTTSIPIKSSGVTSVLASVDANSSLAIRGMRATIPLLIGLVFLLFIYSYAKESELTALLNLHKGNGPTL